MTRWIVSYLSHAHHAAIVRVWATSRMEAMVRVEIAKIAVKIYGAEQERR